MLGVLVVVVGVPLVRYVPIDALRVVVGALLLVLGLSWLRKAILRSSGHKDLARRGQDLRRDGGGAGRRERTPRHAAATAGPGRPRAPDSVAFAVAFKGVFLEGTEVVLIVISLGAAQNRLGLAALAAAAALVIVAGVGLVVSRQLSEVPENTIKTAVGIMLTSFGIFWVGEGAGVNWPGSDLAIPVLVGFFARGDAGLHRVHADEAAGAAARGELRPRDGAPRSPASRPSVTSGGTSSSATRPSSPWPRGSSWPWPSWSTERRTSVGVILLPLLAAGFLLASTLRGRRRAPRA